MVIDYSVFHFRFPPAEKEKKIQQYNEFLFRNNECISFFGSINCLSSSYIYNTNII